MANTALVSKVDANANRHSHCSPGRGFNSTLQAETTAQATQNSSLTSMSFVRELFASRGISTESSDILCASWRNSTKLQYSFYVEKWIRFCQKRKIDPLHFDEVACVSFLTHLFNLGKGYSVLNTARSALSTFLINSFGLTIGNSPLIKRFMKGAFELRPSQPRYNYIWDVSIVFDFLRNYYPNEIIPLKVLTLKCVMLLALSSNAASSNSESH